MGQNVAQRFGSWLARLALAGALVAPVLAMQAPGDAPVYRVRDNGTTGIQFYFFWSQRCPHCLAARPFVERLPQEFPQLQLRAYEVSGNPANAALYVTLARSLGQEAVSVPAFLFCGEMHVGYESEATTGAALRARLKACAAQPEPGAGRAPPVAPLDLPWFGRVDLEATSLPLVTLMLAGLDAFNPCAFFVLLFLLSLMVHARSRSRMALVGGLFVLISGLVYFLFMAAWLNVFLWLGELRGVTLIAGALAIGIGALNIKDYFWFGRGPSLSIPEYARPGLFARMRGLLAATRLWPMLVGTALLAIAANSYELLCTAGFPMVYTRLLTLHALAPGGYYAYLALYNLIYILPLAGIVALFVWTLGARKLSEHQGRVLKLMSGTMMALLGALLLLAPARLVEAGVAAVLLLTALALVALIEGLRRWRVRRHQS
jgi:hypothetical protein